MKTPIFNAQMAACVKFASFFVLLFGVLSVGQASASPCTRSDQDYVERISGAGATAEGAYEFGLRIQKIIVDKDLKALIQLVGNELETGPRRETIKGMGFDEVFDTEWVESVLSDKPSCVPIGWRGYMLGNGEVWYGFIDGKWRITSIIGAKELESKSIDSKWQFGDRVIHPSCFSWPWISRDNFEELAESYGIDDINSFSKHPGKFLGNRVTEFYSIKPSWCDSEDKSCKNVFLVSNIESCSPPNYEYDNSHRGVMVTITRGISSLYEVIDEVLPEICDQLAPDIGAKCQESMLIEVGELTGSSMPWIGAIGVYGIFDLPDIGNSIVPLRFFASENEAHEELDEIEISADPRAN